MAAHSTLSLARRLLLALEAGQSQAALAGQAEDCIGIVEALGYYDLGDHLRRLAETTESVAAADAEQQRASDEMAPKG